MPRGYRLLGAAALGIVVIISFGTGAYFDALHATYNSNHSKEAAYGTGNPEQGNPSQIDRDRAGLPNFVERIASAPDPKDADEREKRDLAAQEASALFSFWMLLATAFSAVITTIGTGILLWQIMLTRKAVQDTGKATVAMEESNKIARNVGEAQVRCYISIKSVNLKRCDNRAPEVHIVVLNSGQSPARKFRFTHHVRLGSEVPEVAWESSPLSEPSPEYHRDVAVGESKLPNQNHAFDERLAKPGEYPRATTFIKVRIWMLWEDVFGNKFEEICNFQNWHGGDCGNFEISLHPDARAVDRPE